MYVWMDPIKHPTITTTITPLLYNTRCKGKGSNKDMSMQLLNNFEFHYLLIFSYSIYEALPSLCKNSLKYIHATPLQYSTTSTY